MADNYEKKMGRLRLCGKAASLAIWIPSQYIRLLRVDGLRGTGSADTIFGFAILISAEGTGKNAILIILSIIG